MARSSGNQVGKQTGGQSKSSLTLVDVVARLSKLYRSPEPASPTTPFALIMWKNIGYLIEDDERAALFAEFRSRVGLSPQAIAGASYATLMDIAKRGGMRPQDRIVKWRAIAAIAIEHADGDLDRTLSTLSATKARSLLKRFPGIGDPGADEILLLSGFDARPSIESNGLRALLRLGFCEEGASYAASYRSAIAVLVEQGKPSRQWRILALRTLRAHGQALCKRSAPKCLACPLQSTCQHVELKGAY